MAWWWHVLLSFGDASDDDDDNDDNYDDDYALGMRKCNREKIYFNWVQEIIWKFKFPVFNNISKYLHMYVCMWIVIVIYVCTYVYISTLNNLFLLFWPTNSVWFKYLLLHLKEKIGKLFVFIIKYNCICKDVATLVVGTSSHLWPNVFGFVHTLDRIICSVRKRSSTNACSCLWASTEGVSIIHPKKYYSRIL